MRSAWALAAIAVAGLIAWPLAGPIWALATVCLGLVLLLARHAANLAALADWLRDPMAKPVPQGSGAWEEVLAGLYRFVRARIRHERELADDLARFRNAGLALPDGVVLLDVHGHIEWCNPIACEYLGLDEQRDLGQPLVNLVRHPDLAAYLEHGEYAEPLTRAWRAARAGCCRWRSLPTARSKNSCARATSPWRRKSKPCGAISSPMSRMN
jgi:two-component system phosphate regulon sensor histidine kinase PhoR